MAKYILDSNIVTCILRRKNELDLSVIQKFQNVLRTNARILICPIVFYEVARGLYHRDTQKQLGALKVLVEESVWCEFTIETWRKGAELWAGCRKEGKPTGGAEEGLDADVLIAAQAYEHNAIVVTNNTKHFSFLKIPIENWLE